MKLAECAAAVDGLYNELMPISRPHVSLSSDEVNRSIDELLLTGQAQTAWAAEELFLNRHLDEIATLTAVLSDQELREHEAIKLLMSHGSRPWEDELM